MFLRKTASLTALLSFILMVATSVVLYVALFGRLGMKARADWTIKEIADKNGTQPHRIHEILTGPANR